MKYTWEACDIQPGRRVRPSDTSRMWMIGYDPSKPKPNLSLVSLDDGMARVTDLSDAEMAAHLNETRMRPVDILPGDVQPTGDKTS